jgi:hypothetical protein
VVFERPVTLEVLGRDAAPLRNRLGVLGIQRTVNDVTARSARSGCSGHAAWPTEKTKPRGTLNSAKMPFSAGKASGLAELVTSVRPPPSMTRPPFDIFANSSARRSLLPRLPSRSELTLSGSRRTPTRYREVDLHRQGTSSDTHASANGRRHLRREGERRRAQPLGAPHRTARA